MEFLKFDINKCVLCGVCVEKCPFGALTIEGNGIVVGDACRMCGLCVRNCPEKAIRFEQKAKSFDKDKWKNFLIYVEQERGEIHPVTFELIGEARKMAVKVGYQVNCVIVGGKGTKENAEKLLPYGVDNVYVYEHEGFEGFRADCYTDAVADCIAANKPSSVLIGATALGRSLAPRLSTRFHTGLTADCTTLDIRSNTDMIQIRPAFGGNIMAQIGITKSRPQFATVRYKVMDKAEKVKNPHGQVVVCPVNEKMADSRIKILSSRIIDKVKSLEEEDVLVVAGRGVRNEKDVEMCRELADALGGQLAFTRPMVENGFGDVAHQIGLSGRTVRPKLIITCGVSGAIQFTSCMTGSDCIVAINNDPEAQIFNVADYCIVDDLYQVVPELTELIKNRKETASDRVWVGDEIAKEYYRDEMPEYGVFPPELYVEVLNKEEISAIMAYAYKENIPVVCRGAGTGLAGGATCKYGGIMLSVMRMNKIFPIDRKNQTITAEPGALLIDIQAAAAAGGLFYPPDPGEKTASIGGNVITNAGGMKAVRYGLTRDFVRCIEAVMPDGSIMNFSSNVVKNTTGYDVKDLVIGSEGTLCILTQVTLKLLPAPTCTCTLVMPFRSLEECADMVPKVLELPFVPTAIEFLERELIDIVERNLNKMFPVKQGEAVLIVMYDASSKQELDSAVEAAAEAALANGALDCCIAGTPERAGAVWSVRGGILEGMKADSVAQEECDVVVPRARIAEYVKAAKKIASAHGIRVEPCGHCGDGNIHTEMLRGPEMSDQEWKEATHASLVELYALSKELGGQLYRKRTSGIPGRVCWPENDRSL